MLIGNVFVSFRKTRGNAVDGILSAFNLFDCKILTFCVGDQQRLYIEKSAEESTGSGNSARHFQVFKAFDTAFLIHGKLVCFEPFGNFVNRLAPFAHFRSGYAQNSQSVAGHKTVHAHYFVFLILIVEFFCRFLARFVRAGQCRRACYVQNVFALVKIFGKTLGEDSFVDLVGNDTGSATDYVVKLLDGDILPIEVGGIIFIVYRKSHRDIFDLVFVAQLLFEIGARIGDYYEIFHKLLLFIKLNCILGCYSRIRM